MREGAVRYFSFGPGWPSRRPPTTMRWFLTGPELPSLRHALRVGELLRRAAMGAARALFGAELPRVLVSHRGEAPATGHRHLFCLAEDADGDGRIDHLVLHAPDGLDSRAVRALDQAQPLAGAGPLPRCRITADWLGDALTPSAPGTLLAPACLWQSVTPYVPPWHRLDTREQLTRECRLRGIPVPEIEPVPCRAHSSGGSGEPVELRRANGSTPPNTAAPPLRLRFARPVPGPLAFGYGCHFGLGLFGHCGEGPCLPPNKQRRMRGQSQASDRALATKA